MEYNPEHASTQVQFPGLETVPFDLDGFANNVALSADLREQRSGHLNINQTEIPENRVGIDRPNKQRHAHNMISLIRTNTLGNKENKNNGQEGRT